MRRQGFLGGDEPHRAYVAAHQTVAAVIRRQDDIFDWHYDPSARLIYRSGYSGLESETDLAYKVNAEAVERLGQIAKDSGKWVLHISTDFVFDGNSDRPYVETDEPNPISEYGKSKLAGERLLVESGCANCIMRLQWTYGKAGNNFVKKIIERARQTGKLRVVDDQLGSPTATTEAAKAICQLLAKQLTGLFHFASAGYVSRFGMAEFIIEKLNMNVELQACKSGDFDSPARRPLNSREKRRWWP